MKTDTNSERGFTKRGCSLPGSISTGHKRLQRTACPDLSFGNSDAVLTAGESLHPRDAAALWQKPGLRQGEFPGDHANSLRFAHNSHMEPYRIQLKGPWDVTGPWPEPGEPSRSVIMPRSWLELFGPIGGTATFARWFHRPTNLVPEDEIAIVLTGVSGSGHVWLNDQSLGEFSAAASPVRFPVRLDQLRQRSRLVIELTWPGGDQIGGLYDPVAIEIVSENP